MATTVVVGVLWGEGVGTADPEARSVTDAEGEELGDPELLAERDADRDSLAVAQSEGVLEKVGFSGVAVSLPLGVIDGEPVLELEFRALREKAADEEALAATSEGLAVGDALALRDTVALPLLLGAPLALAQPVAEDEALKKGDAEGVAKVVAVAFQEGVALPLLRVALLALGKKDAVPHMEEVRLAVAEGEPLVDTENAAVADGLSKGVEVPERHIELQADAEALARSVEQLDGVALPGSEPDWELLAQ